MGREPIKSQAEFLRNRKVISGNQGLKKKKTEDVKLPIKTTKYLRNKDISFFFRLVQIEHNDIKID